MSIQRSDSAPRPMVFEHTTLGQRVLFGSGKAAERLVAELDRLGATRPMIIAGEHEAELVRQVAERAQPALTWNDVVQHVPVELAERARDAAREADVDALVTVGGGSTTGLGKAIALTSGLPLLAVPTTYAGSEATSMWGMTEDRTKSTGLDPKVLPEAVIYDAELSRSLPVGLSVASGLNGLAHCVDSLWAPKADPINQAHALEGARALAIALRGIVKDPEDMHAREQALYGCYLSALSFASAGSGIHHKIAHVLGGTFNLPHAETHATVLPYVLAFNAPAVPELAGRLAAALGYEGTVAGGEARAANDALAALRKDLDAPRALSDVGFTEEDVTEAVERSLQAIPESNPVTPTTENLTVLLRAALQGENPSVVTAATGDASDSTESEEQCQREAQLTEQVLASFDESPDPRLAEVLRSVVTHAHAVVRETRLTEDEWNAAIKFLTDAGNITTDTRQEFVLLSDVLGISMQTIAVNNQAYEDATEATVFGPFFAQDAPRIDQGEDIAGGAPGQPCWVEGTVKDTDGNPVAGARIEVWEADDEGLYDVQHTDGRVYGRAWLESDNDGTFRFWGLTPTPYPIPHDGPVGKMLQSTGRSPYRAAHLHFMVSAPGRRTLVTHIFVEGDPQLEAGDSVFGVKDSLIKTFETHDANEPTPDGRRLDESWASTRFDVVLAPEDV